MFDAQIDVGQASRLLVLRASCAQSNGRLEARPTLSVPTGLRLRRNWGCQRIYLYAFMSICGPNPVLKIKELSQKVKNRSFRSSSPIKPDKGYFHEKNSKFFTGIFM
jgi:hypothetical protein